MAENQKNKFDGPPGGPNDNSQEQHSQEQQHRFDADFQPSAKKEGKRGSFSSSFTPREGSFSRKTERPPREAAPTKDSATTGKPALGTVIDDAFEKQRLLLLLLVMIPLGLFAFWPSLHLMAQTWYYNLDYGHGFLVLPLIAVFLYLRLDTYPGTHRRLAWIGLIPILFSCAMRYYAAGQFFDAVDQWAILFWVLGIVWFFYGSRVFYWAFPSLLFMIFMFPLPFRFEVLLRNRLQEFAAQFAAILLQLLGEPAIPIRNTIRLSTMELDVAAACSGLRFLVSILAIAFAAILLMKRPWWQNLLVLLLAPVLALLVNAMRIALTGILLEHYSDFVRWMAPKANVGVAADEFSGIVMIFIAVGMFFALLAYMGKVFRKVDL